MKIGNRFISLEITVKRSTDKDPITQDTVEKCIRIATEAHEGQRGRDENAVILHPLIVGSMGKTDAEKCVGYEPAYLLSALRHVLGIDCCLSAVLLGATGPGRLLLDGNCLCECGMRLAAVFERLPLADDKKVQGMEIQDFAVLPAFLDQFPVDISIIASPSFANNQTCEMLSQYGVRAVLDITDTSFVCASSSSLMVDKFSLAESLLSLSGMLTQKKAGVFSSTTSA